MANNDTSANVTRFNTVTQTLEYAIGGNWAEIPGIGSVTASEIDSESATNGQVLTADGSGGASFEDNAGATPAGGNTQIQYNNSGAFGASTDFVWDDVSKTLGVGLGSVRYNTPGLSIFGAAGDYIWLLTHFTNGIYIKDNVNGTDTIGIGTQTPAPSAVLDVTSVGNNSGFLPPRMTSAQKTAIGSPAEGLMVYDTDLHKLAVWTGAAWETVTSA